MGSESQIAQVFPYVMSVGMTLLSGLCALCVKILWRLAANVGELNQKMAVIVSELANHMRRTDRHESMLESIDERVRYLERAKG